MPCIDNIIGLTDLDTSCFGDKPSGWADTNASDTGYYLTDPKHGFSVLEEAFSTLPAGQTTVWEMLIRARSKAIMKFKTDLGAAIRNLYYQRTPDRVTIGKVKDSSVQWSTSDFMGIELTPEPIRYGSFFLTHIYLGLDTSGAIDVKIASNEADRVSSGDAFSEQTVNITAVANKFVRHELTTEIELPLYSNIRTQDLRYRIYYEPSGQKPINNNFYCCSDRPHWKKVMGAHGFAVSSSRWAAKDFEGASTGAQGLAIEGHFKCDTVQYLCDLDNIGGEDVQEVAAVTILNLAASFLISDILDSGKINRFTAKPKEELWGRRQRHEGEYNNNVMWLANNLPRAATDCLTCKESKRIQKRSILV
jgi:hypothetical protein